ncbi:Holliday junction DNA helicase subunit RuvA [Anaerosphaera aminiphila DSM 21120]|uniref:Holliday junction branch migration complex subunit RuvA n=1 Tax=Anaerosphaera aminiphila DSM 21120 TaxID=1120995 RepID=A0A1M5RFV7_9FIRM|nr:Holliday junction branch migration protein RuvA [Anaerosphaera aminiphila]SHH25006.1 Holliday junction DNA helicase subunit RuvA [Anaerosphaera aminiphila DSM 21120]
MIDFIYGIVNYISDNYIVIDNGSIGYKISMSSKEIEELEISEEVKVLTKMVVREDDLSLYGFIHRDSRILFELLTTVSGIGPKVGLGILSALTNSEIRKAIMEENYKLLTTAPGVGKKTGERIILELKDKILKYSFDSQIEIEESTVNREKDLDTSPAVEALMSLGYNKYEAKKALSGVDENLEISKVIKEALKNLGR